MSAITHHPSITAPGGLLGWTAELRRRQPELAAISLLFVIAIVPCLMAMAIDVRTVNDVNVWIKPTKFLLSLSVYYATLAWFFGYLPASRQQGLTGLFLVRMPIAIGVFEVSWLVLAAAHGVPSHFNDTELVWALGYAAAGGGAVLLMTAVLVQGVMLARQRTVPLAGPYRHGLALGCVVAFGATLVLAGYMSMSGGHWVGGIHSDAGGLPLFGWSRTGGDLRVAHFFALHTHQLLPLAGWLLARSQVRHGSVLVWIIAAGYLAFTLLTFVQALQGRPFIA
jgi:hypothetical protein